MINLFGGKWEREHGLQGGEKFYVWADAIEDMPKDTLRKKFNAMLNRFESDVALGKDIWPPSLAYFLALNGKSRVNEQAYKPFPKQIMPHTAQEYSEMGEKGMKKLRIVIKGDY